MAIQLKEAKADPSSRYVQSEMCFDNFIAGCSKSSHRKNPLFLCGGGTGICILQGEN